MTDCPLCKHYGLKVLVKKTDRIHNKQVEWQCPSCGWCVMKDIRVMGKKK